MKKFIMHYIWFMKKSIDYMQKPICWIVWHGWFKGLKYAYEMCKWDVMTAEQAQEWYLTSEDRIFYYD